MPSPTRFEGSHFLLMPYPTRFEGSHFLLMPYPTHFEGVGQTGNTLDTRCHHMFACGIHSVLLHSGCSTISTRFPFEWHLHCYPLH